jgi:hypothetical protein
VAAVVVDGRSSERKFQDKRRRIQIFRLAPKRRRRRRRWWWWLPGSRAPVAPAAGRPADGCPLPPGHFKVLLPSGRPQTSVARFGPFKPT